MEELRKRKEELELERDVARLEAEARRRQVTDELTTKATAGLEKTSGWIQRWWWKLPIVLFGVYALLAFLSITFVR